MPHLAVEHSRPRSGVRSSAADLDVIIKSGLGLPVRAFPFVCLEFLHASFFDTEECQTFSTHWEENENKLALWKAGVQLSSCSASVLIKEG